MSYTVEVMIMIQIFQCGADMSIQDQVADFLVLLIIL